MTSSELIKNPPIEYRPGVRWWLAEGLHTDETLRYEIDTAHRLGFGGMEFLAMDEGDIDHARYGWGAEEWVHDSQIVVEETTKRNMSVSFTSGTNWSNANLPTIDADQPAAAKELDVVSENLPGGASRSGTPAAHRSGGRAGERHHLPGQRGVIRPAVARRRRRGPSGGGDRGRSRPGRRLRRRSDRRGPGRGAEVDSAGRRHLADVHVLDARHRPDRIPIRFGQLHRQLRRPRRRSGGDRILGHGGAHAGAA